MDVDNDNQPTPNRTDPDALNQQFSNLNCSDRQVPAAQNSSEATLLVPAVPNNSEATLLSLVELQRQLQEGLQQLRAEQAAFHQNANDTVNYPYSATARTETPPPGEIQWRTSKFPRISAHSTTTFLYVSKSIHYG